MTMYICIAVHMIKVLSIPACLSSSYVVLHVVLVIPSARLSQLVAATGFVALEGLG